jgi:hypothetical protein
VRYAIAGMRSQLFVSKYQLALPKEDEMRAFIEARLNDELPDAETKRSKNTKGKSEQAKPAKVGLQRKRAQRRAAS